jgi:uncharacterized membrane protein
VKFIVLVTRIMREAAMLILLLRPFRGGVMYCAFERFWNRREPRKRLREQDRFVSGNSSLGKPRKSVARIPSCCGITVILCWVSVSHVLFCILILCV